MALSSLSENASRLGMRLQETLAERTRDMSFGKSPSAAFFDTPEDKVRQIRKQLDSNQDREKMEAMKRLIAMISKGRNVSEFFAQVVKNVASHNLEIRKLVYIYLLRYADQEPDLALLSINTFQKDLSDGNPLIRAMALRVLSGIRVPMIGSIVALGIKKCASDISPYVRKAAALAIPKCYSLDPAQHSALMSLLSLLLRDQSPLSIGAVAVAFEALCPDRLDLLHQHYRRLCRLLLDADEWGQVNLLDLLARYARTMLSKPIDPAEKQEEVTKDDVADQPDFLEGEGGMDPDLDLLLECGEPLFQSRNPAVVLAVVRLYYYLGPVSYRTKIVRPLLRLLHVSPETERVVLEDLLVIALNEPDLLRSSYSRFFVRSTDPSHTKRVKIRLLDALLNEDNYHALLREFKGYLNDVSDDVVVDAIHAIGSCARSIPAGQEECLKLLVSLIRSSHDVSVNAAVLVLKSLIISGSSTQGPSSTELVSRLASRLHSVQHPQARAAIVWLVGQYAAVENSDTLINGLPNAPSGVALWAPDVLRQGAKSFASEPEGVKLQLVTLAAKLVVLSPSDERLNLLSRYVLSLARYDASYDVRDRGRTLSSLLQGVSANAAGAGWNEEDNNEDQGGVVLRRDQVRLVLFGGKAPPKPSTTPIQRDKAVLGSLALVLDRSIEGDRRFPEWPEEGTDSSLRDTEEDRPTMMYAQAPIKALQGFGSNSAAPTPIVLTPAGGHSPAGSIPPDRGRDWTDLDKFYSQESSEEEDDEDEEEEEESDEGDPEAAALVKEEKRLATVYEAQRQQAARSEEVDEEEEEEDDEETDEEEGDDGVVYPQPTSQNGAEPLSPVGVDWGGQVRNTEPPDAVTDWNSPR